MSLAANTLPELKPNSVQNWINDLPRASIGKTGELVYKLLRDVSQQDMKPSNQFEVVELIREPLHYVTTNMRKRIAGANYPYSEKTLKVIDGCQTLYEYATHAYITIFHNLQKQNSLFTDKRMLSTTLHRAISYINQLFLLTYESYEAYHHDYWEQLHEAFQFAELHKLENRYVTDRLLLQEGESSIRTEYIKSLLMYLAEPYHLHRGEISRIFPMLEKLAGIVELTGINSIQELINNKIPVVELDRDQPPFIPGAINITSLPEYCRAINLKKMVVRLQQQIVESASSNTETGELDSATLSNNELLRRIADSWNHTRTRRFQRQQNIEKITVTVGLHNIHVEYLEQLEKQAGGNVRKKDNPYYNAEYESIEIKNVNQKSIDVWSTVYSWSKSDSQNANNKDKNSADSAAANTRYNWTLLNESADGFCILTVEENVAQINVGEIITLQRQGSEQKHIGVVRWLKSYGTDGIELGGNFLAPSLTPVGLTSVSKSTGRNNIINRGLLLPEIPTLHRPESLVTVSRHFNSGDKVNINLPDNSNIQVELTRRVADNNFICSYQFVRSDDKQDKKDNSIFNDVWDDL